MPGGKRFFWFEDANALPCGREYTPSGARLNSRDPRFNFLFVFFIRVKFVGSPLPPLEREHGIQRF